MNASESKFSTSKAIGPIAAPPVILCPDCGSPLERQDGRVLCAQNHRYEAVDGIPVLSRNTAYHFLTPSKSQVDEALKIMERSSFADGMDFLLKGLGDEEARELRHYMLDESRAAWKVLLPSLESKRVLDYGCGWGNLAVSLARSAGGVCGLDLSVPRIRFAKRRAAEEGLDNLHFVAGGDAEKLPFPDRSFDVVILNGILEWVPTSRDIHLSPDAAQLAFLRELERITTPEGVICLAIENRLGFKYFYGSRDEHSRLRYITILPRMMADVLSKIRRGIPFREYTHTIWSYRRLLKNAGFPHSEAFIPFWDYRSYEMLVPYSHPEGIFRFIGRRRKIVNLTAHVSARFPFLANAFFIVAGKQPHGQSVGKLSAIDSIGGADPRFVLSPQRPLRNLGTGSVMAFGRIADAGGEGGGEVVFKIPLTPASARSNESAFRNLEWAARSSEIPAWLRPLVPRPLHKLRKDGYDCYIQSRLPGCMGSELAMIPGKKCAVLQEAVRLLVRIYDDTAQETQVTPEMFELSFKKLIAGGLAMLSCCETRPGHVSELEKNIFKHLVGTRLPMVLCHGDFWLKNILFDASSIKPTAILDWDRMCFPGPPLLDLINLLLMSEKRTARWTLADAVAAVGCRLKDASGCPVVNECVSRAGLSDQTVKTLLAVYFLFRLPEEKCRGTDSDIGFVSSLFD